MLHEFTRVVPLDDIRIRSGGDGRTVEAYAAVFNTPADVSDQDGIYQEQVAPSAFVKTLAERSNKVGVFYNHGRSIDGFPSDRFSMPLGVPIEIKADTKGLLTVTRYSNTELADEVLEGIRSGSITGQSFSGLFIKSTPTAPRSGFRRARDGSLPLVTRTEIALREYGPTPFPAYEGAAITSVRAAMFAQLQASTQQIEPDANTTPDGAGDPTDEPQTHSARSLAQRIRAQRIIRSI